MATGRAVLGMGSAARQHPGAWCSGHGAMQEQLCLEFVAGVLPPPESLSQSRWHTVCVTPRVAIRHHVLCTGKAEFACVQEAELTQLPSCWGCCSFPWSLTIDSLWC